MPRLLIQFMHKVRTIGRQTLFVVRPGYLLDEGSPLFQAQEPVARWYRRRHRCLRLLAGGRLPRWWTLLGSLRPLTSGLLRGLLTRGCRWRFLRGSLLPRLRTLWCCLRLLAGLFRRLLALRCALRPRSLPLIGKCERQVPQQRLDAHPKREKGPFAHPLSLNDCLHGAPSLRPTRYYHSGQPQRRAKGGLK